MNDAEDNDDEKVGYKKPPKQHQFKPGKSGNPIGRKRAPPDMDGFMDQYLNEYVWVTENGRKVRRRRKEVVVMRQVNLAMGGADRATQLVMKHDRERARPNFVVEEADAEAVTSALKRLGLNEADSSSNSDGGGASRKSKGLADGVAE
jgi:hypothetical protein